MYIHPSVNDKYVYDKNPYNCFEVIKTGNKIISVFRKHGFYFAVTNNKSKNKDPTTSHSDDNDTISHLYPRVAIIPPEQIKFKTHFI